MSAAGSSLLIAPPPPSIDGDAGDNVLIGTSGDDVINGFGGNDTITGLAGNDTIDGGTGTDTMTGGLGDDIYYVDRASDQVIEAQGEGADLIYSSVSLALAANVENLTLLGTSQINAIGNTLNNTLIGNSANNLLNGGDGNDYLDGMGGADTLVGGRGDDTYVLSGLTDVVIENDLEGNDTIRAGFSYALDKNVENLVLTGTADLSGIGNVLSNTITGNSGANILSGEDSNDTLYGGLGNDTLIGGSGNDYLDGGGGNDAMIGGAGNDTYVVDSADDVIVEDANQGTDTIIVGFDWVLDPNFENLTLSGTDAVSGSGNASDNVLIGNSAVNTLLGLGGNDTLDGGGGGDTLVGGDGNDSYIVRSADDLIVENAGEGTDSVSAGVSYTLVDNVENLTLTGTDAIDGTGNAADNVLIGNDGANTLTGLDGNDTLDGGKGADTLDGGSGDDTYTVDNADDTIVETSGNDTVRSSISWTLGAGLENLVLTGKADLSATGNALDNTITGNDGKNVIDGGAGADTMTGGAGDDTYYVDNVGDKVIETDRAGGNDTIIASVSYTLTGFTDNLTLTGSQDLSATGNALANTILGNSGDNVINGGSARDSLDGAEGSDLYIVTLPTDQFQGEIHDSGAAGIDEVRIAYTAAGYARFSADDTGIERIIIGTGTNATADSSGILAISVSAAKVLNGLTIIGNAGVNRITGTAFADVIDGRQGADTMTGGAGDDIYYVDDTKDHISERKGFGNDTVFASASFKLSAAVETLTLTGSSDIAGYGSGDNNTINGNSGANLLFGDKGDDTLNGGTGNDRLIGGIGHDTLTGGTGADVFAFTTVMSGSDSSDTITDFNSAEGDRVQLTKGAFRGLGSVLGPISADQFYAAPGANSVHDNTDRIIYDTTSGKLWYDSDGLGTNTPALIAEFGTASHPTLSFSDILLVA